MSHPTISEAAALWRQLLSELRLERPLLAVCAAEAVADSVDDSTLIVYAPHYVATILDHPEAHLDLEIILSVITSHRILHLHVVRHPSH